SFMPRSSAIFNLSGALLLLAALVTPARARILWSDPGPTLVRESGRGANILHDAIKRDTSASDTLYFKFHVNPLSDVSMKPYPSGFQLFQGDKERLGVGNSAKEWDYSAFNT